MEGTTYQASSSDTLVVLDLLLGLLGHLLVPLGLSLVPLVALVDPLGL